MRAPCYDIPVCISNCNIPSTTRADRMSGTCSLHKAHHILISIHMYKFLSPSVMVGGWLHVYRGYARVHLKRVATIIIHLPSLVPSPERFQPHQEAIVRPEMNAAMTLFRQTGKKYV
jgi:hypothetical protein